MPLTQRDEFCSRNFEALGSLDNMTLPTYPKMITVLPAYRESSDTSYTFLWCHIKRGGRYPKNTTCIYVEMETGDWSDFQVNACGRRDDEGGKK